MTDTALSQQAKALEAGVQAVIYGLPLVMMDVTMRRAVNVPRPVGAAKTSCGPTLMRCTSSAFLDLSKEPLVLSVGYTGPLLLAADV